LEEAFADAGRPLEALNLPLAWRWAETEVLRVDLFAAAQADPANEKHHERYLATARLQLSVEDKLGMTPSESRRLHGEPDIVLQLAEAARRKMLSD
jgi:hypothetical protein